MKKYQSINELLEKAKEAKGKRLSQFNINNRPLEKKNKGVIGQVIEEGLFGYNINSSREADFQDLGVELKVTGLKKLKSKKMAAKERLVLNIINFHDESKVEFEASDFWKKNQSLLMMLYLYEEELDNFDYEFLDAILYNFPPDDLEIIKRDWTYIREQIRTGKAHLLSEGDTMYLGACTKGSTSDKSLRSQPFSDILAKQRAYCLKNSYLTRIIQQQLFDKHDFKLTSIDELKYKSFEVIIKDKLSGYLGKSDSQLRALFDISPHNKTKNIYEIILSKMLGISGRISKSDEFQKANITPKTIRIEENGNIKESMSFPAFKFSEIIHEDWFDSELRNMFLSKKYMFIVFAKKNGEYYFKNVYFWNMSEEIIDEEVRKVWEKTCDIIRKGTIIKNISKKGKRNTNFPGQSENSICHVRPHGVTTQDEYPLPVPDKLTGKTSYTKHCFWLNKKFVIKVIQALEKKNN